jgi:hypothetical protein
MIGFVASSSIEPKYAAPPANPARTHGMVNAWKRKRILVTLSRALLQINKLTISHFRFPRRIARYSDQGNVFLAPCDTSADWKRMDERTVLRELAARMFLRHT